MSSGLELLRKRMADYLSGEGIAAVTDWPAEARLRQAGPVAVVSLRGIQAGPAGFHSYLGERYNQETKQWEELYGQKVRITFGLDLYTPPDLSEDKSQEALDRLASACCAGRGPEGLTIQEFSCGEPEYDRDERLRKRTAEAVCTICLYAVTEPGGTFLDFEIRGERKG